MPALPGRGARPSAEGLYALPVAALARLPASDDLDCLLGGRKNAVDVLLAGVGVVLANQLVEVRP